MNIVAALQREDIVVRLGGSHLLMSFLGCIGDIMAGNGLKEKLTLIYQPLASEKMLNGQAYARAVGTHMLMHEAY
mgnify:CR=1 FL=1